MAPVGLTLACGRYDRTWPLIDGRVTAEGIDLTIIPLEPEECFFRMMRHAEFDVAEMSLSSYSMVRARGDSRFIAIPVFLSRSFRHSMIYVRPGAGIETPKDLEGRRIGAAEYQMTAAVWIRGILSDEFGVDLDSITWVTGGQEQPGRVERESLVVPDRIKVEPVGTDRTLNQALLDGDIDAIVAPRVPSIFRQGHPGVVRLFDDYPERERDYYERTGIFPIMHMVVIRSEVYERHPWVASSLYKAFAEAKRVALDGITDAPALRYTMPFLLAALEQQERVFGADPWPYGVQPNLEVLETFGRYLVEQGLAGTPPDPDELFAPSTLTESRI